MTRKLIIYDGRNEREVALVGTLIVGRDPSCHISDLDPLLSRRHAEFVSTAKGVTLRDLGSRNGMLVNGDKVSERRLVAGDVVQLGHLQFRFIEDHTVLSPDEHSRANATTAQSFDQATIATPPPQPIVPAAQPEESREPRSYRHGDADYTRVSMPPGAEPTFVRPAADPDATFATPAPSAPPDPRDDEETFAGRAGAVARPTAAPPDNTDDEVTFAGRDRLDAELSERPSPTPSPDFDETFAAPLADTGGAPLPADDDVERDADRTMLGSSLLDRDATTAGGRRFDLDETMAGGSRLAREDEQGDGELERVQTPEGSDPSGQQPSASDDAEPSADLDTTLTPGALRAERLGLDVDATFVMRGPVSPAPAGQPARVVAGADRRIRTASVACDQLLGTAPGQLIGMSLEELFAESLQLVEGPGGPSTLSFSIERSASDRTLTLVITAGQATEPVS